jgi:hypothetical protein
MVAVVQRNGASGRQFAGREHDADNQAVNDENHGRVTLEASQKKSDGENGDDEGGEGRGGEVMMLSIRSIALAQQPSSRNKLS